MHFEGLSFSTEVAGASKNNIHSNKPTKWSMIQAIERSPDLDDFLKNGLIEKINSYPANTMHHFEKNIKKHIKNLQLDKAKAEKDQVDDTNS